MLKYGMNSVCGRVHMSTFFKVLLVILIILVIALVVLYFVGRKMQRKQAGTAGTDGGCEAVRLHAGYR